MNRTELEVLDRDALIARAEEAGVTRARFLTRPELVDELLLRSSADSATKQRSRGLFGLARDLLARVVERGLHLPEAAGRIRAIGSVDRPPAPAIVPTVTLAEIYVAQGHRERAVETLEDVLSREPDHAPARARVAQLKDVAFPVPPPRLAPEKEEEEDDRPPPASVAAPGSVPLTPDAIAVRPEPAHMLDDAPLPTRYDVDECVAIPVDPTTMYVYWELRERTLEHLRATRPVGAIALRSIVIVPTWDGPRSSLRDHDVHVPSGEFFVRELPPGCVVRVAIGYRHGEVFVPVAHSPALETPPGSPLQLPGEVLLRWTPAGLSPLAPGDRDAPSIERAVGRARQQAGGADREVRLPSTRLPHVAEGSSEHWAAAPWVR